MKLNQLFEATVKAGERKAISFDLKKLEKMRKEVGDYYNSQYALKNITVPASQKAELEKIQQGIQAEIDSISSRVLDLEKKEFKQGLPAKFYNLMQGIAKNCSQIVEVYTNLNRGGKGNDPKFFFRGINSTEPALYGKPFEERKAKDSNKLYHELFNQAMVDAGIEARRDNSTFVTGSYGQASGYGQNVYIIFPRDGFSFTWSNERDLIIDNRKLHKMIDRDKIAPLENYVLANKDKLKDYIDDTYNMFGEYTAAATLDKLKNAAAAGLIPDELKPLTDVKNLVTAQGLVNNFDIKTEDLEGAINYRGEVYLSGPYYAVNHKYVNDVLRYLKESDPNPDIADALGVKQDDEKSKFKIGDMVTIKSGQHEGKTGKVTYVYVMGDSVDVLLNGTDFGIPFKINDLETSSQEPKFFVEGDKVEVIDPNSEFQGKVGTVSYVYSSGTVEVYFEGGTYGNVHKNGLELVKTEEPVKFKLGDKVKITKGQHEGKTGKVTYVSNNFPDEVEVTLDSGQLTDVKTKSLELISGDAEDSDKTLTVVDPGLTVFSKGDKISQKEYDDNKEWGLTVDGLDEPDVDDPDFNKVNLDWEPEPEVAKPASEKLKAGDKVKVTGFHYGGHTGTVDDVLKTGMVQVTLDTTGVSKVFYANELAKIENQPAEKPVDKIDAFIASKPFKELLNLGNSKGILTYDQINDTITAQFGETANFSGAQIEKILTAVENEGIEVVESDPTANTMFTDSNELANFIKTAKSNPNMATYDALDQMLQLWLKQQNKTEHDVTADDIDKTLNKISAAGLDLS